MKKTMERAGLWGGVFVVVIIALVLVIVSLIQINTQSPKTINCFYNDSDSHSQWLVDYCDCMEWNGPTSCVPGFVLNGTWCRNGTTVSPILKDCSKYKCPEVVEVKG